MTTEQESATLSDLLRLATVPLRKGPERTVREASAGVRVVEIWDMPAASEWQGPKVDVHFFWVGITDKAPELAPAIRSVMLASLPAERLAEGPSYIDMGALLDSQEAVLCLYGLGEHYGWWTALTPAFMGVTGPEADALAGNGFVMMTGFHAGKGPSME